MKQGILQVTNGAPQIMLVEKQEDVWKSTALPQNW